MIMETTATEFSVVFELSALEKIALQHASKLSLFKGCDLQAEAVFDQSDCFVGLRVIALKKKETR